MALHGNRSVLHKSPVRFLNGGAAILRSNFGKHGMVRNSYQVFAATAAIPYGYYGGRGAWVQPKKGGAVSGVNAIALAIGEPSPLEELFRAIQTQYGRFTMALSLP